MDWFDTFMTRIESPLDPATQRDITVRDIENRIASLRRLWEYMTHDAMATFETDMLIEIARTIDVFADEIMRIFQIRDNPQWWTWDAFVPIPISTPTADAGDTVSHIHDGSTDAVTTWAILEIKRSALIVSVLNTSKRINIDIVNILAQRKNFDTETD